MGLEHEVECPSFCKSAALHLLWTISIIKLVFTKALLANGAIHERITEVGQVTTGLKHCMRAKNCSVDQHDIIALLNHRSNPSIFYVAQHQRAKWAVIVR